MNNNTHRILLRADGNNVIGLGHVIRLLGLCEFLKDSFDCVFFIREPGVKIKETIESFCKLIILKSTKDEEISELESLLSLSDILILDGYDFDERYQQDVKSKVHKLVMIDDLADRYFYADLVINHGGEFLKNKYKKESYTKVLAGLEYLIVRKEFLRASTLERKINKIDSLFICLGGADPFNITIKAMKAALNVDFIKKIVVVTGSAYLNDKELDDIIFNVSKTKIILHERNVIATRIIELLAMCEIAICPSSTIALEVCCVKAGLLTGTVISNQVNLHKQLVNLNCCLTVGDLNKATVKQLSNKLGLLENRKLVEGLIMNQKRKIDGLSPNRLLLEFNALCAC